MTSLSLFPSELAALADSTDAQNTPRDLALDLGWFDYDPCSNPRSHILARRTSMLEAGQDGLADPWTLDGTSGTAPADTFANGPYSYPDPWCERLRDHRGRWCSLWKLETTTEWFRTLVLPPLSGIRRRWPRGKDRVYWAPFNHRIAFERGGNVGVALFCSVLVWRRWQPPRAVLARLLTPRSES